MAKSSDMNTRQVPREEMQFGMHFVDTDGTLYRVHGLRNTTIGVCVYGYTNSGKACGWFTRDVYDVVTIE